jgi:NADP-dependent 3-hydroxy acid dehydrogenase YdfG
MPRVAVITGASSGVGRAIACGLAGDGMALGLVGRELDRLRPVAAAAQDAGSTVRCYAADLAEDRDIAALSENVQRDWPSVDVLVHSAGIISMGRVEEAAVAEFDRQYRVNVRAPYLLTQRLLPLVKACAGQVVFINSSAGLAAKAGVGQYAATKHALKAVADTVRDEVNETGVRVLTVFLGRTATPMQAAIHDLEGKAYAPEHLVQPEDVAAIVVHALGLPRTAEVTEISVRPLWKPGAAQSLEGSG